MRKLRGIALSCATVAMGCFSSPPSVGDEGNSPNSESSSSSSDGPGITTSSSSSDSEASTNADASSSDETSSTSDGSDDDGSTSSTGEAPCGCEGDELLCESFEPPFDPDASPWGVPDGGPDPTVVADPVHCGASALRTAAQPGDLYAATNYGIGVAITQGPHRVRTWIRIEDSCTDAATRIMNIQMWGGGNVWYSWAIYTAPGGLQLLLRNHNSPATEVADAPFETGQWHELELELDVTSVPPHGSVFLDGNLVIDALEGPPLADMVAFQRIHSLQFGIYRDDVPFPGGCVVYYDDVRVTAL